MHAVIIILFVPIVNIYLAKKAQFFPVYSQFIHNSALRETKKTKKTAITLIRNGKLSVDEILTYYPDLSPVDIEDIKKEVMQLA